ncbi:hypothetical protein D0C36_03540 [Mucilaginibacter conchicola]|uniref:DUF5018 domain-containing protein n=1 Tax=Mucilaginibacter conchicola TaxID=2303333 RepID=A0A372NY80_9SPHI|nr:hypothetical protein [Mucilaginibacter conchicola]RFZ94629.1 hypothetical protein D0C36_03540 [Mucilaginibacter conchicola]
MKRNIYIKGIGALLMSLCLFACKKETREIPYPFTQIKSFTVPVAGSDSLGIAIDNSTLTLYWPGTSALPDSITPVIKISDKATITPASGKKVALKDGLTYTVKAQDGTTVTYTLNVINNQAPPQFTSEQELEVYPYIELNLNGMMNYIIPDFDRTKVYLVDAAGKEIQLPLMNVSRIGITAYPDAADASVTLTPGKYKVKVISGDKKVTSQTAFVNIMEPFFKGAYIFNPGPAAWTGKRGTTITLPIRSCPENTPTRVMIDGRELEVVGPTADGTGVQVKIPADFELGNHYIFELRSFNATFEDEIAGYVRSFAPLTITD